jgi:hypothetical protein
MFRFSRPRCAPATRRLRPAVEQLEDRAVPAVFNVNSLADILNPAPGTVTLRSAIQQANHTPGGNTINLTVAGTYKIALAGANEIANATGDFDILASGGNLSIVNASGGHVAIDGGGLDRIFDINPTFDANHPTATPNFKVTLQGLTLQHGVTAPVSGTIQGGGAIQDTGNASLELDNCVVTGNVASGAGGGILMQNTVNTPWTLTLNNTVVSGNHAGDAGGGIDTLGSGKVIVTNSQLTDNTCVNQGAAIWLDTIDNASAALTLTSSLVNRNVAFLGATGALGAAGNGAVAIVSSTVRDNYSGSTGGGFGDENGLANLTILNSQFIDNTAMTNGGGVQAGGQGTTVTISGSLFAGNTAGGKGGGLFASGGTVTVTNTRFTDNSAGNGGGIEDQAAMLTLFFDQLDNNHAVGNGITTTTGGGLDASSLQTTVTINNTLFQANSATDSGRASGGALYLVAGTLTVTSSQFTANVADNLGGAVTATGILQFTGTTFNNNASIGGGSGGAVAISGNGAFTNSTFVANSANVGAAIDYFNLGSTLSLVNDTISGNTAVSGGGGLAITIGNVPTGLTLENTIIALNSAPQTPDLLLGNQGITDKGGNFIGSLAGLSGLGFGAGTLTGNPLLGRLENNGGQSAGLLGSGFIVQTEALLRGSGAIGKGVTAGAPVIDERGFPRPAGGRTLPSIGAYEPQYAAGATANQEFVENLYEVLLNRSAAADPGSQGWVSLLNGGTPAPSVIQAIEASGEYRGYQVQRLFQHYLHRSADPNEQQNFVSYLGNHTLEQMGAYLAGSGEYAALHGGGDNFLTALFEDALNRTPDANELANWEVQLAQTSPGAVAAMVFSSQEFLGDVVDATYQGILGRDADAGGLVGFTGYLMSGATDQALVAQILGSGEAFGARAS